MTFELTVLGKYSPFPQKDGACSGYLLKGGKDSLLLDVGSGVLSRLQKYVEIKELNGVLISHHHPDHRADLHSLRHAWGAYMQRGDVSGPLVIFTPDEPGEEIRKLENHNNIFYLVKLRRGLDYPFKSFLIEWLETTHPLKCAAYAVNFAGKKIVYTGDSELTEKSELYNFSHRADLLLCESSFLEKDKGSVKGHMSAKEAAHLAKKAGVKKLILTHFWPFYPEEELLDEARQIFENCFLAEEERTYKI